MFAILIAAAVAGLDLWTKQMAAAQLAGGSAVPVIGKVLQLTYVENRGAAFGILQGQHLFFLMMTVGIIIGLLYYLYTRREKKWLLTLSIGLIIGGAVGNLVDRMTLGYVVDFIMIDFVDFYHFPVFNIADIGVTTGTALFALHLFFDERKGEHGRTHRK